MVSCSCASREVEMDWSLTDCEWVSALGLRLLLLKGGRGGCKEEWKEGNYGNAVGDVEKKSFFQKKTFS